MPDRLQNLTLAGVVHDLNNVFETLFEANDILKLDPKHAKLSATIKRSLKHGARIVKSLETQGGLTDAERVIEQVEALLMDYLISSRGPAIVVVAEIEANLQVTQETPLVVGHYDALRRAFANVIRNAAEAMLGEGRIEVTIRPWQGGVRVSIADQGPGITLAKQSRVFEPYFTDKTDGTGLGLAIVKQSIDLHQGVIEVAETPGGGATFVIWLPLMPESAKTRPADRPYVERRVADRRTNQR